MSVITVSPREALRPCVNYKPADVIAGKVRHSRWVLSVRVREYGEDHPTYSLEVVSHDFARDSEDEFHCVFFADGERFRTVPDADFEQWVQDICDHGGKGEREAREDLEERNVVGYTVASKAFGLDTGVYRELEATWFMLNRLAGFDIVGPG